MRLAYDNNFCLESKIYYSYPSEFFLFKVHTLNKLDAKYKNAKSKTDMNQLHHSIYITRNTVKSLKSNSLKTNNSLQAEFTYIWHEEILPTYWCLVMTEARKRSDIWLSSLKQYRKKWWCKNWWAYFIFRGKNVNAMGCPFSI